jgi:hypothetical protein
MPMPDDLPQKPGHYLFYYVDIPSYLGVGYVHVTKDPEKHLEYLRGKQTEYRAAGKKVDYCVYQNRAGDWLTMYFDHHNPPGTDADGFPHPDGYRKFSTDWLFGDTENAQEVLPPRYHRLTEDGKIVPV